MTTQPFQNDSNPMNICQLKIFFSGSVIKKVGNQQTLYVGFSKRKHSMAPVVKVSVVLLTETSILSHLKMHVAISQCSLSPSTSPNPRPKQEKLVSSSTPPQIFSHSLATVTLKQAEKLMRSLQLMPSTSSFLAQVLFIIISHQLLRKR